MQDRYAGDIGDFAKLGLLRRLLPQHRLGVIWYKFPNQSGNNDGGHIDYLNKPLQYAHLDEELFYHLQKVVAGNRTINSLLPMLRGASFFNDSVDHSSMPNKQIRDWRDDWFSQALSSVANCDIVFADPDNGIVDNDQKRRGEAKFGKQIPLHEVHALAEGRCAIIYHHNTRRKGGHDAEVDHWLEQFNTPSLAIRANAYSPRTFFVLNPTPKIAETVRHFCHEWKSVRVELH